MEYPKELIEFNNNRDLTKSLSNYGRKNSKIGNMIRNCTDFLDKSVPIKERLYYIEHNIHEHIKCDICNMNDVAIDLGLMHPRKCSIKCAAVDKERNIKIKNTTVDRHGGMGYGSKSIQKTIIEEYCKKTGEDSTNISNVYQLESVKSKINGSLSSKYAIELDDKDISSPFQIPSIRQKALDSIHLNHATENEHDLIITSPMQLSKINNKTSISLIKFNKNLDPQSRKNKWVKSIQNSSNASKSTLEELYDNLYDIDYMSKLINIYPNISTLSNHIGISRGLVRKILKNFGLYNKNYSIEQEVLEYCQSLGSNGICNTRSIIKPLELDVYLPDQNLAIEYDGLYWHSSDSIETENKDYHLNKTNLCQEKGIQLFHIFENEWVDPIKQAIWKSIIKNRLGQSSRIYARKTKVAQITSKDKHEFLNDNHLQGTCQSSVNLGLYLGDELISVMTFGKSRYNKKIDWELLRFCNKREYSVVGGAGKLLAAFRRGHLGSIISYADKRRSTGGLYEKLGFSLSHESGPNYFYFKGSMKLESRVKYQKHKLEKVLDVFDKDLTESQNMYNNGYSKIYDCGNSVWVIE